MKFSSGLDTCWILHLEERKCSECAENKGNCVYGGAMAARRRRSGVPAQHATATRANHINATSTGSGFEEALPTSIAETKAQATVFAARANAETILSRTSKYRTFTAYGRSSALGNVTACPAKTEPRSATDASSATPCDVRPHGHGSGWKHAAVPRDNVRSWSRSARKSRPPSGNGETTTMRTDTSHLPNPACQGLPRWTPSMCSFHMPKRLNALNSMKKNVAMDTNIWPWAYAVAQNVQRNDWNMNVPIAM